MRTTMHVMAALGVLGAATAGANADHNKDKFRVHISIGSGYPWAVGGACEPVRYEPVSCEPVYRQETVWEELPRTEVWYDWCGRRHTRTVYERVCRTVWVPVYACGHTHHTHHAHNGWRGHNGRGGYGGYDGPDGRDYPQTWGLGDERRSGAGSTKEIKPQDRVSALETARAAASPPVALPGRDARAPAARVVDASTKDALRAPHGNAMDGARSKGKAIEPAKLGGRLGQLKGRKP